MLHVAQHLAVAVLTFVLPADAPAAESVRTAAALGLTPEAMVVAGLTPNEALALVDNLGTTSDTAVALAAMQADVAAKSAAFEAAEASLRASPGSSELRQACNTARSDLMKSSDAFLASRVTLRTALIASLSEQKRTILAAFDAAAGRSVPHEFKAISRSDAEWAALESALRAEVRATRRGETLAAGPAAVLAEARSNATVSAAKARLDAVLAEMSQAMTPAAAVQS